MLRLPVTLPSPIWFYLVLRVSLRVPTGSIQTQDGNFILTQAGGFILTQSAL